MSWNKISDIPPPKDTPVWITIRKSTSDRYHVNLGEYNLDVDNKYKWFYNCDECEAESDIDLYFVEYWKPCQVPSPPNSPKDIYTISVTDVTKFRRELVKMIEQIKYNIGEYSEGSSSELALRFENIINDNTVTDDSSN